MVFLILFIMGCLLVLYKTQQDKYKSIITILMWFGMAFLITAFAAWFGPIFFALMDFEVNSSVTQISTSDATSFLLSSLVTVVFGFVFLELTKRKT